MYWCIALRDDLHSFFQLLFDKIVEIWVETVNRYCGYRHRCITRDWEVVVHSLLSRMRNAHSFSHSRSEKACHISVLRNNDTKECCVPVLFPGMGRVAEFAFLRTGTQVEFAFLGTGTRVEFPFLGTRNTLLSESK